MVNELIIQKIENRETKLATTGQGNNLFPLSPTHRKELRTLKSENCGNLQNRLHTIKRMKKEEYTKKYEGKILKELELNKKKYDKAISEVKKENVLITQTLTKLFSKTNSLIEKYEGDTLFSITKGYYLKQVISNHSRMEGEYKDSLKYSFNSEALKNEIIDKEFSDKFGESFKKCLSMIESLEKQYEEAINFGDLDMVKEIYYYLKDSEKFFEQISELKV